MEELKNRIDFVYVFDVQDGNPNGDPDAGNMPRADVETGQGIVTDVCLKRKVRNYVQTTKGCSQGYDIFIKERAVLNNLIKKACEDERVTSIEGTDKESIKARQDEAQRIMCECYYDVRTFGAVMSTGDKEDREEKNSKKAKNAGQVRGPIQLTFSRSVEPIFSTEHAITRMAITKEADADKQEGDNRTMGRKFTIPYGLYVCHGFISANLARQTGFGEEDLQLFWEALKNMFDVDRSAARGLMSAQKLIVFRHESELGNAPANKLFDLVRIARKDTEKPARSLADYEVRVEKDKLPEGVTVEEML